MRNGWEEKRLIDCCKIVNGGTPKSKVADYWGGEHQWITPAEMGGRTSYEISSTRRTLTDNGLANCSAKLLPPNSVILSSRAPIGHLVINKVPMATNQGCKGIIPSEEICSEFICYYLSSIVPQLNALGTGATFKELSGRKLSTVLVPVPPLPEQRRIVAILDEAFEGIAAAKANAEKNLENARDIFDSAVMHIVDERANGWEEKTLLELCDIFVDSAHRTPKYMDDGLYPALRPRDVVKGVLNLDGAKRVGKSEYETQCKRHVPSSGDIVYSRELSFGWAAVLPNEPRVCLSQGMCLFRPNYEIDTSYLLALLNSPVVRCQAEESAVGTAHPHINLGPIKGYAIPLPPRDEQKDIIEIFNTYSRNGKRIEQIYDEKLSSLDELKKSLLHQAFNGDL